MHLYTILPEQTIFHSGGHIVYGSPCDMTWGQFLPTYNSTLRGGTYYFIIFWHLLFSLCPTK